MVLANFEVLGGELSGPQFPGAVNPSVDPQKQDGAALNDGGRKRPRLQGRLMMLWMFISDRDYHSTHVISKGQVVRRHVGHAAMEVVVGAVSVMAKLGISERHLRREVLRRVKNTRVHVRWQRLLERGL